MPGERFEIWTTDFDAAGHNVETKSEKEVLKLPALEINGILQTNNNINILTDEVNKYINIGIKKEEDENIEISITHTLNGTEADDINGSIEWFEGLNGEGYKYDDSQQQESWENELPADTTIWQLKMGGLIKVPAIHYDNAGHAKHFTEQYFRLPSYEDDKGNDLASELNIVKNSIKTYMEER